MKQSFGPVERETTMFEISYDIYFQFFSENSETHQFNHLFDATLFTFLFVFEVVLILATAAIDELLANFRRRIIVVSLKVCKTSSWLFWLRANIHLCLKDWKETFQFIFRFFSQTKWTKTMINSRFVFDIFTWLLISLCESKNTQKSKSPEKCLHFQ